MIMPFEPKSAKIKQLLLDESTRDGDRMDVECIPLCDVLNLLDGVGTISSCCGHGYAPFRVYFVVGGLECLKPILTLIDESPLWSMRVSMATGNMETYFILDGPTGDKGFSAANELASLIESQLNESKVAVDR
jgi:hypothetical protein